MEPITFSAVLLAAGRSRRMGLDKALLPWAGRPLWQRQWELLGQLSPQARWLSVRPEQRWVPADAPVLYDAYPEIGPLAGVAAALARCETPHLAVLAVDLPGVPVAWFERLRALCRPGRGAVGWRAGRHEPLAAIYPRELLSSAQAALAGGEGSLQRLLATSAERWQRVEIRPEEEAWFANWNTPADLPGSADDFRSKSP